MTCPITQIVYFKKAFFAAGQVTNQPPSYISANYWANRKARKIQIQSKKWRFFKQIQSKHDAFSDQIQTYNQKISRNEKNRHIFAKNFVTKNFVYEESIQIRNGHHQQWQQSRPRKWKRIS